MLPLVLDLAKIPVALVGSGEAAMRRRAQLIEAGAAHIREEITPGCRVAFIVSRDEAEIAALVAQARQEGVLLHVEDRREYCDFHMPAQVRRGNLLLTVSTGGRAAGLSRLIRERLETLFPESWAERLEALATERGNWKREGVGMEALFARIKAYVETRGWL